MANNVNNCNEFSFEDVITIVAIPIANIPVSDAGSYANVLTPTISAEGFNPSLEGAITIGHQPAVAGGILVPMRYGTGKAKDSESDAVAGRAHTVTVNCEVDDRNGEVWAHLLTLERSDRHLLLIFRNDVRAFVSATRDTYLCNVERDGAKTTVTFKIHNLMGIQLLV